VVYSEKLKKDRVINFKMRISLNSGPVIVSDTGIRKSRLLLELGNTQNLQSSIEYLTNQGLACIVVSYDYGDLNCSVWSLIRRMTRSMVKFKIEPG